MTDKHKPVAKVTAGAQGGLTAATISALAAAFLIDDYRTIIIIVATSFLPVIVQFGVAWIKTDPELKKLKRVLDEMQRQQGNREH